MLSGLRRGISVGKLQVQRAVALHIRWPSVMSCRSLRLSGSKDNRCAGSGCASEAVDGVYTPAACPRPQCIPAVDSTNSRSTSFGEALHCGAVHQCARQRRLLHLIELRAQQGSHFRGGGCFVFRCNGLGIQQARNGWVINAKASTAPSVPVRGKMMNGEHAFATARPALEPTRTCTSHALSIGCC